MITILLDAAINFQLDQLINNDPLAYAILAFIGVFFIFFTYCLTKQPMNEKSSSFQVPFVPIIPMISVFVNILLMFNLSIITWARFSIWMTLGKFFKIKI